MDHLRLTYLTYDSLLSMSEDITGDAKDAWQYTKLIIVLRMLSNRNEDRLSPQANC